MSYGANMFSHISLSPSYIKILPLTQATEVEMMRLSVYTTPTSWNLGQAKINSSDLK